MKLGEKVESADIFTIIISAMGIAVFLNIIAKKFDIPVIIGYIATGTIILYLFDLSGAAKSYELTHIAEFGIVFLMFMIGLEFSADKIKSLRQEVLLFGSLQVVISALIFFVLTRYLFGIDVKTSVIISCAFALSSTAIVLKSLNESKEIHTPYGKNVLGILIFQDIAVIPILLLITLLADSSKTVTELLTNTAIQAVIVLFLLFVPGKRVINYLLKISANTKMDEIFVGMILFIVIGTSMLVGLFGFSYSLGAFIAGMIIAETKYKYQVEADLVHFRDLFLGFFFVTVGMQVDIFHLFENFALIFQILIGILLLKTLIIYAIIRFFKDAENSLQTAISLSQVGEFSFAIFALSFAHGIIEDSIQKTLILVVIFSMILTPFILKNIHKLTSIFVNEKELNPEKLNKYLSDLRDHVIVCGYGTFGSEVVGYLKSYDIKYIAVDYNLRNVERGIKKGDNVFFGNVSLSGIMEKLHVEDSVAVIIAINDTEKIRVVSEKIVERAKNCNIIVKVSSDHEENLVKNLKVYKTINEKKEVAKILAQSAISCEYNRVKQGG